MVIVIDNVDAQLTRKRLHPCFDSDNTGNSLQALTVTA